MYLLRQMQGSPVMSLVLVLVNVLQVSGSNEIWRVSSVPDTGDFSKLLAPFQPIHHSWGQDSLAYSDRHSAPSLSAHYRRGSYSKTSHRGGGFYSTPSSLGKDVDNLILMYDVYFDNFGWGNGGKLPGLFGGEEGEGAYKCSGGHNPSTCFSLRLMWRAGGQGELYAYISDNQSSGLSSRNDVIAHHNFGQSIGRGKIHFKSGQWQTVMELVHLNSSPTTADGYVKVCVISGGGSRECFTADKLVIRKNSRHHLRGVFFSTFFGGSKKEDGAPHDCHAYFKNFRLKYPTGDIHNIIG